MYNFPEKELDMNTFATGFEPDDALLHHGKSNNDRPASVIGQSSSLVATSSRALTTSPGGNLSFMFGSTPIIKPSWLDIKHRVTGPHPTSELDTLEELTLFTVEWTVMTTAAVNNFVDRFLHQIYSAAIVFK